MSLIDFYTEQLEQKGSFSITEEEAQAQVEQETYELAEEIISYYRENIPDFCEDYLNMNLHDFQKAIISAMNDNNYTMFLGGRGISKTFTTAAFCAGRCLLYPGTAIAVASGNRKQAVLLIKKIVEIIMPNSPCLQAEVEDFSLSVDKAFIKFRNGSSMQVVTASENSRGYRANILILDEFRMVNEITLTTVLRKFLTAPREPGYLNLPEYKANKKKYQERNKEIYMSSAWYCSHWSYRKCKDYAAKMMNDRMNYFVCGLPYQLAIKEGLLLQGAVEDEMSEATFNEIVWGMEMECRWFGDFAGGFFEYPVLEKSRTVPFPMLPKISGSRIGDDKHFSIPDKKLDEIRILSADIALMGSKKSENDASAIFINQMLPSTRGYTYNFVYAESSEGLLTSQQALQIRKLYEEFDCDYIVLDCQGVGLGVYDCLVEEIVDQETGYTYPPLSCCNDERMAERCVDPHADKVIWSVKADAQFNSDCATQLREGFRSGKIKLLISEFDCDELLDEIRTYKSATQEEKNIVLTQYINTSLAITELINLHSEVVNGKIRVKEKSGARKDRYSSLSYNCYVARQIETRNRTLNNRALKIGNLFDFRAPRIRR